MKLNKSGQEWLMSTERERQQGHHSECKAYREHGWYTLLGLLQQVLEVQQDGLRLVLVNEGGSNARLAAAPCAPDAMHIVLDLVRHIIIDDVLDVGEVQSLAGHVCCHQHILFARLYKMRSQPQ